MSKQAMAGEQHGDAASVGFVDDPFAEMEWPLNNMNNIGKDEDDGDYEHGLPEGAVPVKIKLKVPLNMLIEGGAMG